MVVIFMEIGMFIVGLTFLIKGADIFVEHISRIAKALRIPELVIGLTIVAFATSLPELGVSLAAALSGHPGITVANIIGSNIANIGFVLGLSALFKVSTIKKEEIIQGIYMIIITVIAGLFMFGGIQNEEGVALFVLVVLYFINIIMHRDISKVGEGIKFHFKDIWVSIFGLLGIYFGSRWLVSSTVSIAQILGISELFISITIIAIGTSLPELATSVTAALKGYRGIALGNIIGSNIINLTTVLGLTAIFTPLTVPTKLLLYNVPAMLFFSVLMIVIMATQRKIERSEGLFLLLLYVLFIIAQVFI